MRKSTSMSWRFSRKGYEPELLELKLEIQQLKTDNRLMRIQLDRRAERDREVRMSVNNSAPQKSERERKRTSPRSRKQLREGMEREKSITRLDSARRDSFGDADAGRNRSPSTQSDNTAEDVFLRDNIRSDFTREISRSGDLFGSRSDLFASSSSASEFEYLQKEMAVLRDRLIEQQSLFKQEETSRY
jgi:hypothetical protein